VCQFFKLVEHPSNSQNTLKANVIVPQVEVLQLGKILKQHLDRDISNIMPLCMYDRGYQHGSSHLGCESSFCQCFLADQRAI
jgi:hypothetical protein